MTREQEIDRKLAEALKSFTKQVKEDMKYIKWAEESIKSGRIEIMKAISDAKKAIGEEQGCYPDEDIMNEAAREIWINAEEVIKRIDTIKENWQSLGWEYNSIIISHTKNAKYVHR
jgi:hypothetical protein